MRTRIFLLAASVTSLAAAGIVQGCGDTEETPATTDAGPDVVEAAPRDTAPAVEPDAETCDTTQDLTKDIPDADLADGASTSGICLGCAKAKCAGFIDDCNKNCECQALAGKALTCYTKTGNAIGCASDFIGSNVSKETQNTGIALFGCINSGCKQECATAAFNDGGTDGGKDAAKD